MSSTMPEASDAAPASPDVLLEELEDDMLRMLEESEEKEEAENGTTESTDGAKDVSATPMASLDPEVAEALEAELFGPADASGEESDDVDVSETELFGPDGEADAARANDGPPAANASAGAGEAAAPDATSNEDSQARAREDDPTRYMQDENGNLLRKWKVDYAPRGGGGRAQCKDNDCLERMDQGGVRTIEKGCLRIGRRVLMEQDGGGHVVMMWYHARCIFNCFLRARKTTRVIESEFDIDGFSEIAFEDQETLRNLISKQTNLKDARFHSREGGSTTTPQKRDAAGAGMIGESAAKKKKEAEQKLMKDGDRVWTFFRCLPKETPGAAPGVAAVSVKSEKPELAAFREVMGDSAIVQFESEEHEKERIEMFQSKRGKRIRGWLRYPRLFEGRKMKVPVSWIQWKRNPPALCGCKQQAWGHACPCGIDCKRGSRPKVWGVGDTAFG